MSLASVSAAEIQQLSVSPAFSMSLGAKELFHTNFLAFLLESYDPALEPMQRAIRNALHFPVADGALARCAVWREKNNLDLVLVELRVEPVVPPNGEALDAGKFDAAVSDLSAPTWQWDGERWYTGPGMAAADMAKPDLFVDRSAGRVLVLEAKLKSLPNQAQLDKYDAQICSSSTLLRAPEDAVKPDIVCKFGGNSTVKIERTLLSISGQAMSTPEAIVQRGKKSVNKPVNYWKGASWPNLHDAMKAKSASLEASLIKETLIDYIQVLGALVTVIENVHRMSEHAHASEDTVPTYGSIRKQTLAAAFKDLRIHDLLGKTLFDHWMTQYIVIPDQITVPRDWSVNRYIHYSRAVPGLNIEFVKSMHTMPDGHVNTFRIGIQVQGPDCRLFVSVDKAWAGLESWVANSDAFINTWFSNDEYDAAPVGTNGFSIMPPRKPGRCTNLMIFDKNEFLYSVIRIDDMSIRLVEETISNLIKHAGQILPELFVSCYDPSGYMQDRD